MTNDTEKKRTETNQNSDILEARIIANYGDPGLDEDFHFDILSRYVIVMIESCQRVPTRDKYSNMLAIVKRPEKLWIQAASTPDNNATNQKRLDDKGNATVGLAGSFSTNGISRIYPEYSFGESVRIRKLSQPIKTDDSFFQSAFSTWEDGVSTSYAGWHSDGSSLPYFQNDEMKFQLRMKTISPVSPGSFYYNGLVNKMQYEAFALSLNQGNSNITNGITSIFDGSWKDKSIYSAHGGYLFKSINSVLLSAVSYEDINIGGKERVASNECIPLVVATPKSFPTPSVRGIGTIVYNPTYSPIAR